MREEIDKQLAKALNRDTVNYEVANACPACTFTLEEEESLKYSLLVAMDGNNSLKRAGRKKYDRDDKGKRIKGTVIEREMGKTYESDVYLSEEFVDKFKYEVKSRKPEQVSE